MGNHAHDHAPDGQPTQQLPAASATTHLQLVPAVAPAAGPGSPNWFVRNALLVGIVALACAILASVGAFVATRLSPETAFQQRALPLVVEVQEVLEGATTPESLPSAAGSLSDLAEDIDDAAAFGAKSKASEYHAAADQLVEVSESLAAFAALPRKDVSPQAISDVEAAIDDSNEALGAWNDAHGSGDATFEQLDGSALVAAQQKNSDEFKAEVAARNKQRAAARKHNLRVQAINAKLRSAKGEFRTIASQYQGSRNATQAWANQIRDRRWIDVSPYDFADLNSQIDARSSLLARVRALGSKSPSGIQPELDAYAGVLQEAINGMSAAGEGLEATVSLTTPYLTVSETPAWNLGFGPASASISGRLSSTEQAVTKKIHSEIAKHKPRKVLPPITE